MISSTDTHLLQCLTADTACPSQVGQTYGPFDLPRLECGQVHPKWQAIHMMPEESVQAAIDLRAAVAIPFTGLRSRLHYIRWYERVSGSRRKHFWASGDNTTHWPVDHYWWRAAG
ncbi:MAG: hypothetical protein IPF79_05890 [Ignavibacteria bacterium]|nr:hypothetical protein [Ignavibacteria bacterium]